MSPAAIADFIVDTFAGVEVVPAGEDLFFFYDPQRDSDPTRRLPFATIVTSDAYDDVSQLDRPGVFRLNIGAGKQTFDALFGAPPSPGDASDATTGGHDFTVLDRIMPHPVYGTMFWVCVLNPSAATFRTAQPLLAEAYERAVQQHARARTARGKRAPSPSTQDDTGR